MRWPRPGAGGRPVSCWRAEPGRSPGGGHPRFDVADDSTLTARFGPRSLSPSGALVLAGLALVGAARSARRRLTPQGRWARPLQIADSAGIAPKAHLLQIAVGARAGR